MRQECACCIMLHSEARATPVLHYAIASCHKFMHRQGDVIFNMPPEHNQRKLMAYDRWVCELCSLPML